VRITTWNLQGRERPDLAVVAEILDELRSDVVLLQEVQRRQATRLGRRLGWSGIAWRLKHWPVVIPAEGLAVLATGGVTGVETVVLASRWAFWSSRRRIAVAADVEHGGATVRVVDTHLGAGVGDAERARQAALVVRLAVRATPSVVGGDLNTAPGSPVIEALTAAGHADAWEVCRGDEPGPTNWKSGPRHGAPVQRLDYLLVDPELEVVGISVPRHGEPGFDRFGPISDHLPVTVTLAVP
jgi:endonuclease/exonuclease/phosphatase family metal-dependent hydrolase